MNKFEFSKLFKNIQVHFSGDGRISYASFHKKDDVRPFGLIKGFVKSNKTGVLKDLRYLFERNLEIPDFILKRVYRCMYNKEFAKEITNPITNRSTDLYVLYNGYDKSVYL